MNAPDVDHWQDPSYLRTVKEAHLALGEPDLSSRTEKSNGIYEITFTESIQIFKNLIHVPPTSWLQLDRYEPDLVKVALTDVVFEGITVFFGRALSAQPQDKELYLTTCVERVPQSPSFLKLLTSGQLYRVILLTRTEPGNTNVENHYFTIDDTGVVHSTVDKRFPTLTKRGQTIYRDNVFRAKVALAEALRLSMVMVKQPYRLRVPTVFSVLTVPLHPKALESMAWMVMQKDLPVDEDYPLADVMNYHNERLTQGGHVDADALQKFIKASRIFSFGGHQLGVVKASDLLSPKSAKKLNPPTKPVKDSSMNQNKFDRLLKNQTAVAQKVLSSLAPDTDYTLQSIYVAVLDAGHTTRNQRVVKAATMDLVETGLLVQQGDSFHRPRINGVELTAKPAPAKTPAKKEIVKTQHGAKANTPVIKPAVTTTSSPEMRSQSVLPDDWTGSFLHGRKSSYNPSGTNFVTENVYDSGLSKHHMVRASKIGDVIRYPISKPKTAKQAYARFANVTRLAAKEVQLGAEIHAFTTYVDILMVPLERTTLAGEYIDSRTLMEEILRNAVPFEEELVQVKSNGEGWVLSLLTTTVTQYDPMNQQVTMARGAVMAKQSYAGLKKCKVGETMRFHRDPTWTQDMIHTRFVYVLNRYAAILGLHLEMHAFRDYIDIYVTNIPITSERPVQLKPFYTRPPIDLSMVEVETVQIATKPIQVPPVEEVADVVKVAAAIAPPAGDPAEAVTIAPPSNEKDLSLWQNTFQKLLDQNVDSDEAIERATRAVAAMQRLRNGGAAIT